MSIDQLFERPKADFDSYFDYHPPAGRLARSSARRSDATGGAAVHCGAIRARHHHAQSGAAGDHCRGGRSLSRPHPRRPAARFRFPAADDLLSHRHDLSRRNRKGPWRRESGLRPSSIRPAQPPMPTTASPISSASPACFERMEKIGMPVLIHGEATDPAIDIFDREAVFMQQSLLPLLKRHAGLKVVVEHVTTAETADIIRAHAPRVAGTITPHHLVINRTSIFQGGLRPHLYCLPVAKRERHRLALRKAATSGVKLLLHRNRHCAAPEEPKRSGLRLRRHLCRRRGLANLCPGLRRGKCTGSF